MSGRASRVAVSVLLLLAAAIPAVVFLPNASAATPAVTLQATNKGSQLCSAPSCSFGVVVAAGASTLVTVYVATGGGNDINVTSASCNSQPLTMLVNFTTGVFGGTPTAFARMYLFYGVGFAPGSLVCGGTVVRAGPSGTYVVWADQVWSNVLQSAPISQHAQATGTTQTTMSATLSTVPASTHVIADFVATCCQLHTPTPGAPQVDQWGQFFAGENIDHGSTKPGGGTATMTWTVTLANDAWGLYVIDIAAVPLIIDTFTFSVSGLVAAFVSSVSGGAGSPYNTTWAFGDGGVAYAANPSHTYAASGTYTVYLNVTDAGSNTASASSAVTVASGGGPSSPPPPSLPPSVVRYPQIVQLNCAQVVFSDPRGSAAVASTVLWVYDFGDGSRLAYSPVPTVNHTYAFPRVYQATMTTQDRQGNIQTYGMTVDTTPLGCAVSAVRILGPPGTLGLAIALLAASLVVPRKSKYAAFRGRFRKAAIGAAMAFLFVVVVFA